MIIGRRPHAYGGNFEWFDQFEQFLCIGYERFSLPASNRIVSHFFGHQLVYYTLKDRNYAPTTDMDINHKDKNGQNNHPDNLELIIRQENSAHGVGITTYRYRKNEVSGAFVDELECNCMLAAARSVQYLSSLNETTISLRIKGSFDFKHEVLGHYWSAIPLRLWRENFGT